MKRKYSILILLLSITCFQVKSQSKKSISAIAGYSDKGFSSTINFQFYPDHTFKNFYELSLYTGFLEETQTDYKVKLNIYSINAGYHFRIDQLTARSNVIVTTLGLGGVVIL